MSSEEYRTDSLETYRSSSEDAHHGSETDQPTDMFQMSEVEKEIEDEHYDDFKTYVEMLVEIGRKELKPLQLTDCYPSDRPGMYLEILPKVIFETVETETGIEEVDFPKPIFRLTIDQGTIASVEHTSSFAQTLRSKLLNSWCQYEPRLFSEEEKNASLSSESFGSFLKTAEKGVFESLIHNKTADSFFWELKSLFGEESRVETSKETALTMTGSFVCLEGDQKKIISCISWHPMIKDIFIASTLCCKTFKERIRDAIRAQNDSYTFYVWSCKNQFMPKIFLEYFEEITLHKFNPKISNVVVGGTLSGQLVLWNLPEDVLFEDKDADEFSGLYSTPSILSYCAISNLDHNHVRGINDIVWIPNHIEVSMRGTVKLNPSNESYQIATCGSDRMLKFWDLRAGYQNKPGFSVSKMFHRLDGKWEPFHTVEIQFEEKKNVSITKFVFRESQNLVKLEKESTVEDKPRKEKQIFTEFYAGCDDGQIFCGNFKLYRDDAGKFRSHPPENFKSPHSGSITAMILSPFISDVFLSTGARTICIWKHEIKATPIYYKVMHTYITSAEWSNTRPALFILGYADGSIEIWDLLHNIYEPFLINFVSTTSISAISVQSLSEEEHVVAVGDAEGTIYVLSLPSYLWMPVEDELKFMEEFIVKESVRVQENVLTAKVLKPSEDIKIKAEKVIHIIEETSSNEALQQNYEDFLSLEQVQLRHLGLITEKQSENVLEEEEEIE